MNQENMSVVLPLLSWSPGLGGSQRETVETVTQSLLSWLRYCQSDPEVVLTVWSPEDVLPLLLTASESREPLRALARDGRIQFGSFAASFNSVPARDETILRAFARARAIVAGLLGAPVNTEAALVAGANTGLISFLARSGAAVIVDPRSTSQPPLCQLITTDGLHVWLFRPASAGDTASVGIKVVDIDPTTAPERAIAAARGGQQSRMIAGLDRVAADVLHAAESTGGRLPLAGHTEEADATSDRALAAAATGAENVLIDAERLAALASISGAADRPDLALDHAWRQTWYAMQVAGARDLPSAMRSDALAACANAADVAMQTIGHAGTALAEKIDTAHGQPAEAQTILVVNTLGSARTDVVETRLHFDSAVASFAITDYRGKPVPHEVLRSGEDDRIRHWADVCFLAEEVPGLGWRAYFVRPLRAPSVQPEPTEAEEATIENAFLRITASLAAGGVTSIVDRRARREILGGSPGARLVGQAPETYVPSQMMVHRGPAASRIILSGHHREVGQWRQTLALRPGLARVDVDVAFGGTPRQPLRMLWRLAGAGHTPVWGSDTGAQVGGVGHTRVVRNWLDLGHIALLRHGRLAHAIGPCVVVTPMHLQELARRLVAVLVAAGAPARTALPTEAAGLGQENTYLLLGAPHENQQTAALLEGASEVIRDRFLRALARNGQATAIFSGRNQQSTVIIAGRDLERLSQIVESWTSSLAQGQIELPRDTPVAGELPTAHHDAVALLADGSITAQLTADGEVSLELAPDHRTRFALLPHRGNWRSARLCQVGDSLAHPLRAVVVSPPTGALPAVASGLQVKGDVVVTGLRLGADGAGTFQPNTRAPSNAVYLSLHETRGHMQEVRVAALWPVEAAWRCSPLGQRESELPVVRAKDLALRIHAREIATIEVNLDCPSPPAPGSSLGPGGLNPIPVRYWAWGLGAAPLGSVPIAACLHGQPQIGETTRFTLTLVNNQLDAEARGSVRLAAPEGWQLTPAQVPYRLPAGGQHSYEIAAIIPSDEAPGTITAEVEWQGRSFVDTLVIGEWQPLQCSLARRAGRLVVTITNPNPREVWGQAVVAAAGHSPQPFTVAGNNSTEAVFDLPDDTAQEAILPVAKVMYHQRADYIGLDQRETT